MPASPQVLLLIARGHSSFRTGCEPPFAACCSDFPASMHWCLVIARGQPGALRPPEGRAGCPPFELRRPSGVWPALFALFADSLRCLPGGPASRASRPLLDDDGAAPPLLFWLEVEVCRHCLVLKSGSLLEPPHEAIASMADSPSATATPSAGLLCPGVTRSTVTTRLPTRSDSFGWMFCPRCGAESAEGSRYCAACGAELPKKGDRPSDMEGTSVGLRDRFERISGRSRQARLLTLGTLIAVAVAIGAFVVLKPAGEGSTSAREDAFTRTLDTSCVQRKRAIAAAQSAALAAGTLGAVGRYGDSLVVIAGEWRMMLRDLRSPGQSESLEGLESALLEVEIEAGTLARIARESDRQTLGRSAAQVDAATGHVEAAVGSLGLERCARLSVGQGRLVRR